MRTKLHCESKEDSTQKTEMPRVLDKPFCVELFVILKDKNFPGLNQPPPYITDQK